MGFIGGGQVGYNMQLSKLFVVGLEADIQGKTGTSNGSIAAGQVVVGVPVTSIQTVSAKTDWIGTVRGRVGILLAPTWLVYFTGGLAYGGNDASSTLFQSGTNGFVGTGAGSLSTTRVGGTFGAGLEWMFARNWSAKAEYLFYDLGTANFSYPASRPASSSHRCTRTSPIPCTSKATSPGSASTITSERAPVRRRLDAPDLEASELDEGPEQQIAVGAFARPSVPADVSCAIVVRRLGAPSPQRLCDRRRHPRDDG